MQAYREHSFAKHRENHPVRSHKPESALDEDGGEQFSIASDIAHAFGDGREIGEITHLERRQVFRMRLGEAHAADQQRGRHEGQRVQHEDGCAAGGDQHESAQCRADGEIEGPGGRGQPVGHRQLFGGSDVGNDSAMARLEQGPANGFEKQQREEQPQSAARPHQHHGKNNDGARPIRENHDFFAADPVVDHAGRRRHQALRQHLHHEGEGHHLGATSDLEQEAENGNRVEPVAQLAHDLRHPQQPEVAIIADQAPVRRERHGVYKPIAFFTLRMVSSAMGEMRSAPSLRTRAT